MRLNTLKPAPGAVKDRKRVGRGQGSGRGGTATRGHKGARSRSGYKSKRGFEGGQLPLQRRLPRYGFKSPNKLVYKPINLEVLQQLVEREKLTCVNESVLLNHGLIGRRERYKVLGSGVLKDKIDVSAYAFSASARASIEQLGGKATTIDVYA